MCSCQSGSFSLSLSSCIHLLNSDLFDSRSPPFDLRINVSDIYGTHIIAIATIFTVFLEKLMTNKALWLAFHGFFDLTSDQVFSIIKHFLESSDLFILMTLELLTIENISTWAFAITAIIRTVVWLRSKEWLTETLEFMICKIFPSMTLFEKFSVASNFQLETFFPLSLGIEVFEDIEGSDFITIIKSLLMTEMNSTCAIAFSSIV